MSFHVEVVAKNFTSISFFVASTYPNAVQRYTLQYLVIDVANFVGKVFLSDFNFTNLTLNTANPTFSRSINPPTGGNLFGHGNVPYIYCVLVHM